MMKTRRVRHVNATLLAFAAERRAAAPPLQVAGARRRRSMSPTRTALSSKPAARHCCGRMTGQTDGPFHTLCCIYDASSLNKLSPRGRRYIPPPMAVRLAADLRPSADGSAVRHGYAAGSQRAYSLGQLHHGTDRRTDRLMPPPPFGGSIIRRTGVPTQTTVTYKLLPPLIPVTLLRPNRN